MSSSESSSELLSPELVRIFYLTCCHLLRVHYLNYVSSVTVPELVQVRVAQCSHSVL